MAGDEYSAVGGGGKLKLKGSKVKDGRVEKKKKREKEIDSAKAKDEPTTKDDPARSEQDPETSRRRRDSPNSGGDHDDEKDARVIYKTEAERKYEEQRKKRLNERLRREGVKTHKERVEELNRYLSTLSEHHDMPKIGPG